MYHGCMGWDLLKTVILRRRLSCLARFKSELSAIVIMSPSVSKRKKIREMSIN